VYLVFLWKTDFDKAARGAGAAESFLQKVQPMLATVTTSAIATALGVSWVYASHIRAGSKRPHPRHWVKLAKLAGIFGQPNGERFS
jgi:hypothetical protein